MSRKWDLLDLLEVQEQSFKVLQTRVQENPLLYTTINYTNACANPNL